MPGFRDTEIDDMPAHAPAPIAPPDRITGWRSQQCLGKFSTSLFDQISIVCRLRKPPFDHRIVEDAVKIALGR